MKRGALPARSASGVGLADATGSGASTVSFTATAGGLADATGSGSVEFSIGAGGEGVSTSETTTGPGSNKPTWYYKWPDKQPKQKKYLYDEWEEEEQRAFVDAVEEEIVMAAVMEYYT